MTKKIILIALISTVTFALLQLYGAWRIYQQSTFTFVNFKDIISIFSGDKKITVEADNPTGRKLVIRDLKINILADSGNKIGGFAPVDLDIRQGMNQIVLTFEESTKYLKIGADIVTGSINDYELQFSGLWLGLIPFRFKTKLSKFIN